jgi:hypothetical protein
MRVISTDSAEGLYYQVRALSLRLRHAEEPQVRINLASRLAEVAAELAKLEAAQLQKAED